MSIPTEPLVKVLERQADHELLASQAYLAMAYWCDVHHYAGFAAFFHRQSGEERAHAQKLFKHLVDREVTPKIGPVPPPPCQYRNLLEIAQAAYDFERANTAGINAAYETALEGKDYPAQVLLHWFINEQVEEEAWSDKMVAKVREAGCAGALLNLDRHIEKILGAVPGGG